MADTSTEKAVVLNSLVAALFGGIIVAASFAALVQPAAGLHGGFQEFRYILTVAAVLYIAFVAMNVVGEWILGLGKRDGAIFAPVSVFVPTFYVFGIVAAILFSSTPGAGIAWWKLMIMGLLGAAAMFASPLFREPILASDIRHAWRGIIGKPVKVTCPETNATVTIMYDARIGWIQRCSRWPKCYACARNCIASSPAAGAPSGSRAA